MYEREENRKRSCEWVLYLEIVREPTSRLLRHIPLYNVWARLIAVMIPCIPGRLKAPLPGQKWGPMMKSYPYSKWNQSHHLSISKLMRTPDADVHLGIGILLLPERYHLYYCVSIIIAEKPFSWIRRRHFCSSCSCLLKVSTSSTNFLFPSEQ